MNQISVPVLAFMLAAIAASAPRAVAQPARQPGLRAADVYQLRSVGDVQISPDGQTIVYAVVNTMTGRIAGILGLATDGGDRTNATLARRQRTGDGTPVLA